MRWFSIRKAAYQDPSLPETFERYGVGTIQNLLAASGQLRHKGNLTNIGSLVKDLLVWLTEQYDRAERKETWSLSMEFAIVVLVAAELLFSIGRAFCGR